MASISSFSHPSITSMSVSQIVPQKELTTSSIYQCHMPLRASHHASSFGSSASSTNSTSPHNINLQNSNCGAYETLGAYGIPSVPTHNPSTDRISSCSPHHLNSSSSSSNSARDTYVQMGYGYAAAVAASSAACNNNVNNSNTASTVSSHHNSTSGKQQQFFASCFYSPWV